MSYPGVDPSDTIVAEPVGTQAVSEGEPKPNPLIVQEPIVNHEKMTEQKLAEDARIAAVEAAKHMFDISPAWKPREVVKFVIEFESGQNALVKHMTTMDLVNANLIEDMDFFTQKIFLTQEPAISDEELASNSTRSFWTLISDPEKRRRFLDMTGKLMAISSVKPKIVHDGVAIIEEDGESRTIFGNEISSLAMQIELLGKPVPAIAEGQTYSSAVGIGDRLNWFQELQKPLELIKPFRGQQDALLGSVQPSEVAELPPI